MTTSSQFAADAARRLGVAAGRTSAKGRRFLLVGGPFSPFFADLAAELTRRGGRARRVVTNGAEVLDLLRPGALAYVGPADLFAAWVRKRIARDEITDIVAYGDSYHYCAAAAEAGHALGLRVHVLEQGYLRPHWVTVEAGGVNGRSRLPRDPDYYRANGRVDARPSRPHRSAGRVTKANVVFGFFANVAYYLFGPIFARHENPYGWSPITQGAAYTEHYFRSRLALKETARREARVLAMQSPYFLVLMQKPQDSQITVHSPFRDVDDFCQHVLEEFAANGPAKAHLVFKSHPLDQGIIPHEALITKRAKELGVGARVHFVDGGNLAPMLKRSDGAITINSTSGLVASEFGRPIITLGDAFYNMAGLTHQGDLKSFWDAPQQPDHDLYLRFRDVVIQRTQENGGYSTIAGRRMLLGPVAERILAVPAGA